jgi:hypothetical protein
MALLHHWTMVTSRSIVNSPKVDHLWQTVFPEIAYAHSYVMHGLLSLSALHIAYLHPEQRREHLHVASQHHVLALSGLRSDMDAISPSNADAVFASATLMFLYAFTTFSKLSDAIDPDSALRKCRILGQEWIPLVHGVHMVVGPTYEYLKAGPLRSTLSLQHWDDVDPDVDPGRDDAHMLKLAEAWRDDDNKGLYDEALRLLRRASAWISHFQNLPDDKRDEWGYNRDWSAVSLSQHPLSLSFSSLLTLPAVYLALVRAERLLYVAAPKAAAGFAPLCVLWCPAAAAAVQALVARQLREEYRWRCGRLFRAVLG